MGNHILAVTTKLVPSLVSGFKMVTLLFLAAAIGIQGTFALSCLVSVYV